MGQAEPAAPCPHWKASDKGWPCRGFTHVAAEAPVPEVGGHFGPPQAWEGAFEGPLSQKLKKNKAKKP